MVAFGGSLDDENNLTVSRPLWQKEHRAASEEPDWFVASALQIRTHSSQMYNGP
jgi:phage major head subunit gpT-like protein